MGLGSEVKRNLKRVWGKVRLAKWSVLFGSVAIARAFVYIDGSFTLLEPDRRSVRIGRGVVRLTPGNAQTFTYAWSLMQDLAENAGARWRALDETAFEAEINGVRVKVSTYEEAFILHEIFLEGIYALEGQAPARVIDIGANVGCASLYFAQQPWVERVIGFEPIAPTCGKARANLERNPELAGKISLNNYGLAGSDRTVSVLYAEEWAGSVGMTEVNRSVAKSKNRRNEEMVLRRASSVLEELGVAAGGRTIAKVDCEGAEYEIFDDLAASGLLKRFAGFLIEWHGAGGNVRLTKLLREQGYTVSEGKQYPDGNLGLIYALRE